MGGVRQQIFSASLLPFSTYLQPWPLLLPWLKGTMGHEPLLNHKMFLIFRKEFPAFVLFKKDFLGCMFLSLVFRSYSKDQNSKKETQILENLYCSVNTTTNCRFSNSPLPKIHQLSDSKLPFPFFEGFLSFYFFFAIESIDSNYK